MQEIKFNVKSLREMIQMSVLRKKFTSQGLNTRSVIPRDHGGATSWENVVISCIRCNSKKVIVRREAGMRLLQEPSVLNVYRHLYGKPMEDTGHSSRKVVRFF